MNKLERGKRLNIVLPMRTVSRIENLKEKTSTATATEVIKTALLVYEVLVGQIADGNKLYINKTGEDRFYPVNFVFEVVPSKTVQLPAADRVVY